MLRIGSNYRNLVTHCLRINLDGRGFQWVLANCIAQTVYAGTPKGVGPVKPGQKVTAGITNLLDIHFNVEKRQKLRS